VTPETEQFPVSTYVPGCQGYEDQAHKMWRLEAGTHFCPHCGQDISAVAPAVESFPYVPGCLGYEDMAHQLWRRDTNAHNCPQCGVDISAPPQPASPKPTPAYSHPADEWFESLALYLRHLVDTHGLKETPDLWASGRDQFDVLHNHEHDVF
jgi:predicted RNA-binding Zn-ribbon protein involved in translation (DUF1610 family)